MPRAAAPGSTRERILDVALDLFVEKGYDAASLREIAEALDISKAAVYYHFASKEEILLALHLRLHEVGERAFEQLQAVPATPQSWGQLLQDLMGELLDERKLFMLHARNFATLEEIQGTEHRHDDDRPDFEGAFRKVFEDPALPLRDRVRMAGMVGSLMAGLLLYSQAPGEVSPEEYADVLRGMIADIMPAEPV